MRINESILEDADLAMPMATLIPAFSQREKEVVRARWRRNPVISKEARATLARATTVQIGRRLNPFQKDVRTINVHIQNIFEEGELSPESVIRKFRITAADGKTYDTQPQRIDSEFEKLTKQLNKIHAEARRTRRKKP